jgi:hypothetical protein
LPTPADIEQGKTQDITGFHLIFAYGMDRNFYGGALGMIHHTRGEGGGVSAALINITERDFSGAQGALINFTMGDVIGVQWGLGNYSNSLEGAHIGLMNLSRNTVDGVQYGLFNFGSGKITGAQFGLINFGEDVAGTQIGLLNISRKVDGVPAGLINIMYDGDYEIASWNSSTSKIHGGLKMRGTYGYSILTYSYDIESSGNRAHAAGFGLGLGFDLGSWFAIDTDLIGSNDFSEFAKNYEEGKDKRSADRNHDESKKQNYYKFRLDLRVTPVLKIAGPLRLFAGPVLYSKFEKGKNTKFGIDYNAGLSLFF